ncbi:Glutaminase A [Podosphaera aphanis]|nr:Glutaminase A [Podosphaera aphanis]
MNTWLQIGSNGSGTLPGQWPRFWADSQSIPGDEGDGAITGWAGLIKVDGISFTWMGVTGATSVVQESLEYTSTRSTFIMNVVGKISLNVTFISPINPSDYKRQSIIGTYLDLTVVSVDGKNHSVQLYADISAEWVNPTHSHTPVKWNYNITNGVASHKIYQETQVEFNEDYADDSAHWGYWYWSTAATKNMTFQSGADQIVRGKFMQSGKLYNTHDLNYRPIDSNYPVFAFGDVGAKPLSVLYSISHVQQNAVMFNGIHGITAIPSLWTSYFRSDYEMIEFFYKDRKNETGSLDQRILLDSLETGGHDYLTITALSARQAFGAVQLLGTSKKPYLFLKEISSNGNCQTVDVIYPAIPIFLYLNPDLVKLLLEPLYENQEAGKYPHTYAMHDLGANYPLAIGHDKGDDGKPFPTNLLIAFAHSYHVEEMPLEECGDMIITTLAYAQRTKDIDYLISHYPILKQWVGYLISEALIPAGQLSTDDFQGPLANQTNLALKGIIAIEAMSVIANLTGHDNDWRNFTNVAHDYILRWQSYAVVPGKVPHTSLAYGDKNSYGLLYNLYADRLLGLGLVPQEIYDMQSAFYPTVVQPFGVPLDTRYLTTKSDWQMWAAAISSPSTRSMFIYRLASWINNTPTNRAFSDLYHTKTGNFWTARFMARPVVGGHFALLALKKIPSAAGTIFNA